jgi:hypothetical protein
MASRPDPGRDREAYVRLGQARQGRAVRGRLRGARAGPARRGAGDGGRAAVVRRRIADLERALGKGDLDKKRYAIAAALQILTRAWSDADRRIPSPRA